MAVTAYAQTITMKVDVPFAFNAGNKLLPAGTYYVRTDAQDNRMEIQLGGTAIGAFLPARPALRATAPERGTLVFHKYGEHYVLRRVWTASHRSGYELPMSNAEREMARLAGTQVAAVLVK